MLYRLICLGDLHPPRGCLGGQERGGPQERGRRVQRGQIPLRRQQQVHLSFVEVIVNVHSGFIAILKEGIVFYFIKV